MLRFRVLTTAGVLLGLAIPAAANAVPITQTYIFTATSFTAGAPFPSVNGVAVVSFDTAVSQPPATPLSFETSLPQSFGIFSFGYNATGLQLVFGDNCNGGPPPRLQTCSVVSGTDQASFAFNLDPTTLLPEPLTASFTYATSSTDRGFTSISVNITASNGIGAPLPVPEPASLALLATGILGVTFAVRRRA